MSTLVFKLRNVPEDEAIDVRALLEEHRIEFYETTAGNWGIAMPGIWVQDEDLERSRTLIDEYQVKRAEEQRELFNSAGANGHPTAWYAHFLKQPFATLGIVLFCLFIVYALLSPFIRMATGA